MPLSSAGGRKRAKKSRPEGRQVSEENVQDYKGGTDE